jgi:hypothetical protein
VGDVSSSLGACLANINRYDSKKEFMKDFGTSAAINGSLSCIALSVPILGDFIAIGGMGYFVARIYSNESASNSSKNR